MGTIAEMKNQANKNKPFKVEIKSERELTENIKYNKCIRCLEDGKYNGWTNDKLLSFIPNLHIIKTKEYYRKPDGSIYCVYETYYKCTKCNAELTVEDFEKKYCKKYKVANKNEEY